MQHQPTPSANMVQEVAVISGSSGFIGTHLMKKLISQDIKVVAIPRDILQRPDHLNSFIRKINPDYIFHLSAYGNHAHQKNITETVSVNYADTFSLLCASVDIPYKAFINVSTSSVLLEHETFYSATKAGAEHLCYAFADGYDKPIVNVRPYSIYGPGEGDHRFIPTVFRSCLSGEKMTLSPDAVHDWLYVSSFVEGMINTAKNADLLKGTNVNFGTGGGATNMEIVRMIERITKKQANYTLGESLRSFDTTDWVCEMDEETYLWGKEFMPTLEEGLRLVYESIRN